MKTTNSVAFAPYEREEARFIVLNGKAPARRGNWRDPQNQVGWEAAQREIAAGQNIGYVVPSGEVVFDVDPRNGGDESYERLLEDLSLEELTASSPVTITGGGGMHIYLSLPVGFDSENVRAKLEGYPGIDVKKHGGYVVAAGSVHPETRQPYTVFNNCASPPIHEALLMAITRAAPIANTAAPRAPGELTPGQLGELLERLDVAEFREHDKWFRAMEAAHHATNGDATACAAFVEWSTADPLYAGAEADIRKRWLSLKTNHPQPVTAATLYRELSPEARRALSAQQGFDAIDLSGARKLTDLGNAERLVDAHGADLAYTTAHGWLLYDGARWCRDERDLRVRDLSAYTLREIWKEIDRVEDSKQKEALSKHARTSERVERIDAAVKLARPMLRIAAGAFDSDPFAFNVLNGTIDLRTGMLRPHNRNDMISKLAHVTFDPGAGCPCWLQFLDEIFEGDAELIAFVQRAVGYSLTGETREQCFFLLYGTGANGKSTLVNTLRALLGEYGATAAFESFTASNRTGGGARGDLARLVGARLVSASEGEAGQTLAESVVKQLTGGETIAVRHLYCEEFEFAPTFKIWLSTNHEPQIRGTDEAIWRRVLEIPFNATFPEGRRDPRLGEKLAAELPGILNWAIEGCLAWQREGLKAPRAVRAAVAEYRTEQDRLAPFLEECTEKADDAFTASADLHRVYSQWCGARHDRPWSSNAFGRALAERGFQRDKISGVRGFVGIRLRAQAHFDPVSASPIGAPMARA